MFAIGIVSNIDLAMKEIEAEASIKLENQMLTRANRKLEQDFNPIFGYPPSPSSSHEAVITRLASLYEDSDYGPSYFRGSAQILKTLLLEYKEAKTDPIYDMFCLLKAKNGIHMNFNSVTKKKEVVIPVGHPSIDPIRIDIGKFRSWYRKQRKATIAAARIKAEKEIMKLYEKLAQAAEDRSNSYIDQCQAEVDTMKALLKAYSETDDCIEIDKLNDLYTKMKKDVSKPKEEYLSTNQDIDKIRAEEGMSEKKIFLEKLIKAIEIATKKTNIVRDIYSSFNDEILLLNSNNK